MAAELCPTIESLTDDFLGSPQFAFIASEYKERAPALLSSFASACGARGAASPEKLSIAILDDVLMNHIARLDLPVEARRGATDVLRAFFDYLAQSGRYPPALSWLGWLTGLEGNYRARLRDDGSVKGETFRKRYTDVNRNDPCPCGSGKKFKKCCMKLIG